MLERFKMRKYIKVTFPDDWERIDTFLAVDRPFEPAKIRKRLGKNEENEIRNTDNKEIQE